MAIHIHFDMCDINKIYNILFICFVVVVFISSADICKSVVVLSLVFIECGLIRPILHLSWFKPVIQLHYYTQLVLSDYFLVRDSLA